MTDLVQKFHDNSGIKDLPQIRPGLTLKIHQKIKEGAKTRTQIFEGLVIAQKHGTGLSGTVTVRKIASGVGVERIFPLHLPTIEKIEVVKAAKVRRSKLYYIRHKTARETRRKTKILALKDTTKVKEAASSTEAVE